MAPQRRRPPTSVPSWLGTVLRATRNWQVPTEAASGSAGVLLGGDAAAAARLVLARLAECWTECGPGQLAGRPEAQAAECMAGIVVCYNLLLELLPSVNDGKYPASAALQSLPSCCAACHGA